MEKTELDHTIGTLQLLTRVEAAMANYYTACSETWSERSSLWMDLAIEEEKHEKIINDLVKIIMAYPDQFKTRLTIEPSAIESFIASINEKVPDLRHGKVTLKGALEFALGMEESIIEGRFFDLVASDNSRYLKFSDTMASDLEKHRWKIIQELEKGKRSEDS